MLGLDINPHDQLNKRDETGAASATTSPSTKTGTKPSSVDWIVVANYIIDFDFLLHEVPELVSFPRVVIVYGHADSEPPPTATAWATPTAVDLLCRRPSDPPFTSNNPLPFQIPYGVHHSKLFLIGYSTGVLRVIIHTANLRYDDIHLKTQGAYIQDFFLKTNSATATTTTARPPSQSNDFEDTLVAYIASYGYSKSHVWNSHSSSSSSSSSKTTPCALIQQLRCYDFSTAQAILIPSTPGYHSLTHDGGCHVGHLRLRSVLTTWARRNRKRSIVSETPVAATLSQRQQRSVSPIICQFSSMGSLTEAWLRELERSMDVNALLANQKSTAASSSRHHPLQLQFVYPTVEEIRSSVEGYRGGGSVPGSTKNIRKPFLRSLYHKWSATTNTYTSSTSKGQETFQRSRHVPHIKTYYQLTPDQKGMEWFVLSSHNMSKAAWGDVIRSRQHSDNEQRLFIRHWELGVLLLNKSESSTTTTTTDSGSSSSSLSQLSSSLKPVSHTEEQDESSVMRIPLPYQLRPEPYQSSDRPWAVDGVYTVQDAFGRFGC